MTGVRLQLSSRTGHLSRKRDIAKQLLEAAINNITTKQTKISDYLTKKVLCCMQYKTTLLCIDMRGVLRLFYEHFPVYPGKNS